MKLIRNCLILWIVAVGSVWAQSIPISSLLPNELQQKGVATNTARASLVSTAKLAALPQYSAATAAQVAGLMIKFRDTGVQALSVQNLPPPAPLIQAVQTAAGAPIFYSRALVGSMHVFRFPNAIPIEQATAIAATIRELASIERVGLDLLVSAQQSGSSDPGMRYQWNMRGARDGVPGGIDATSAWPVSYGTDYPVVAIVDSGLLPHPEFAGRRLPGYDFVSNPNSARDGDGLDADAEDAGTWALAGECGPGSPTQPSSWHGTFVAGIVGADGSNGEGIAGVSWRTRLLPVRVLGKCGTGPMSDVFMGILWAAGIEVPGAPTNPNPAHVINVSINAPTPSGCTWEFQELTNMVAAKGALLVVAAGNDSSDAGKAVPSGCEGVLAVYATDYLGRRASYSNIARVGGIAAPGGDLNRYGAGYGIWSTVGSGTTSRGDPTYREDQGTSFAAPHVSGVAALALSVNHNLSAAELTLLMQLTATPFASGDVCDSGVCGSGIVNSYLTVVAASAMKDRALIYEFYNSGANHFFRTGNKAEAAAVNTGSAGPGWYDTVNYFYAWSVPVVGTSPVCRFYSPKANSHFYTANLAECDAVKRNTDWNYEGISFYAKVAINGACESGLRPVYRVYNNRHAFNDQNHRFTTDQATYQSMIQKGWRGEGVALCV